MSRPAQRCLCVPLSNWEVVEAWCDHRNGTTIDALAERYGVCTKTLERAFARLVAMAREMGLVA